jgi:transcriptional regulator NrdR family protein
MRKCYEERDNTESTVSYKDELHERFSGEKMHKKFVDAFYEDNEVTDDEIESLFASLE